MKTLCVSDGCLQGRDGGFVSANIMKNMLQHVQQKYYAAVMQNCWENAFFVFYRKSNLGFMLCFTDSMIKRNIIFTKLRLG